MQSLKISTSIVALLFSIIATLSLSGISVATAQESEPDPDQEDVPVEAIECTEVDRVELDEQTIRACTDGRVIVEEGDEIEVRFASGRIDALLQRDGDVWVITRQQLATPLTALAAEDGVPLIPPAPVPPSPPEPAEEPEPATEPEPEPQPVEIPSLIAEVLESELGRVIIDIGAEDGVEMGDQIEFFVERTTNLGDSETTTRQETIAVAPVTSVSDNRAGVELGLNERIPDDARARPTELSATANQIAPPRLGSMTRVSFTLRPFLALDTLGAGTISNALVAYQFAGPWTVEANFEPLAAGVGRNGGLVAITGTGILSYDTRLFQVGLGVGGTTINTTNPEYQDDDVDGIEIAPAITQKIRLGSLDGLYLQVMNSFFYAADAFRYGGTTAEVQVPVGALGSFVDTSWIVGRGGGSFAGHSFGEVGLRVLVRGNGDHGSLYFTPSVGGSQLRNVRTESIEEPVGTRPETDQQEISYGGPMIGFQVEWRP